MSERVVEITALGKRYRRFGRDAISYDTVREAIASVLGKPQASAGQTGADGRASADFWALRDVSFELDRGDVLGIIGQNGAGKSRLLKVLSRITPPTEGRAALHGPGREPSRSRHRIPSGADRTREHLSQRRHPRHASPRDSREV